MKVELFPHPTTTAGPAERVGVDVERAGGNSLRLTYTVEGDLAQICLPQAVGTGTHMDGLWKHTCFEAFVAPVDQPSYIEFNFSPSLDWASYRFDSYRQGMTPTDIQPSSMQGWRESPFRFEVVLDTEGLARKDLPPPAWKLGLSAVIEAIDGSLSYWALAHPSDKPDFHHPDSFILDLP